MQFKICYTVTWRVDGSTRNTAVARDIPSTALDKTIEEMLDNGAETTDITIEVSL